MPESSASGVMDTMKKQADRYKEMGETSGNFSFRDGKLGKGENLLYRFSLSLSLRPTRCH